MSGLELLLSKTLSKQSSTGDQELPSDFPTALGELVNYCDKQLPSVLDLDFMPVCFDISKDEENLIIGGQHGNLAVYNVPSRFKVKDEEICDDYSVVSVLFTLHERQIVLCSSNAELFFLDYPALRVLGKLNLDYTPVPLAGTEIVVNVIMKLGAHEDWLYFCQYDEKVDMIKLTNEKGYYTKGVTRAFRKTESKVVCMDVSDDGTLIAVGCENGSVGLIHSDTESSLQTTGESSSRPIIVTFGIKRVLLAAGFEDNSIRVWNLDSNLTLRYEFTKHSDTISGLAFMNDNRYLVTSSHDSSVIIWDMKVESLPYSLNLFDTKVLCFKSSRDAKKVYFSQSKNSILVWEIPQLYKNARYRKHSHTVQKLIFLPNAFELLSLGADGLAVLWDFRNDLMQDFVQLEGSLVNGAIPKEGDFVMIVSSKPCIYRWDFRTGCIDEFEFNSPSLAIEYSVDNFTLAISDSLSRVIIYDADVMERKFVLKSHKAPVTAVAFIESDSFLLTASMDCEIGKWDTVTGERVGSFKGHRNSITAMIVSPDNMVISASDESIHMWNFSGVLIYIMEVSALDAGRNISLSISSDSKYLIALQENRLNYWQLDNLSVMFETDTMETAHHLAVSVDERFVAVAEGNTIFVEENPLHAVATRIVGKNLGSRHQYMRFIIESQQKDSKATYTTDYNHWVAVPYLIGASHVLAFSNRIDDLSGAVFDTENRAGFFSTVNGENPMSIAVELEYKNIIDICLKYMKQQLNRKNIRAFASIEKCLTQLNSIEYPFIAKVYDLIFSKCEAPYLPAFCLHEAELPMLHTSDHLELIPDEIVPKELFSSTGRPIVFHQSLCLLDMELGTTSSLEFLQSLLEGDASVYNSKIVKEFLTCKWDRITTAVNTQGCLYIIYMVLLSFYTVSFIQDKYFFSLVVFMHLILFSIELLQLATDYTNYFFDAWNLIDLFRTTSFFIYMYQLYPFTFLTPKEVKLLELEEYDTDFFYDYLLAVIVFSWLRGISYFRMFDGTRYMVRLLGMVLLDMRVFGTILAYSTLGFSFIFYLRHPEDHPFFIYLMTSYRLDLGDFNTDYTVLFDWIVFFMATMMNPMIMLNLLISILSDTAARVSADNYVANLQELTRMIIEVEKVMFWKKNVTTKHFLQVLNFVEDDPQADKVLGRCKFIKQKLDKVQRRLETVNEQMDGVNILQIEASVKYLVQEQEKLKEEMNANFEENNNLLAKIGERMKLV